MTAQQTMIAKYGEPGTDYQLHWCMIWEVQLDFPWFPAKRFMVNKDFKTKLFAAFTNLEKAGRHTEIKTFDGCYNDRMVRGYAGTPSMHDWAAAIDMNAADNPMVSDPAPAQRPGKWSGQFIAIMKAAGIFFGGEFIHRSDPMHWALFNG